MLGPVVSCENAYFEFQRSAWNAEFTRDPQRECEFRVPAKRLECRIHLGSAARMRIWSSSEALGMQSSLGIRSENANLEFQRGAWNAEFTTDPQRECEITRRPPAAPRRPQEAPEGHRRAQEHPRWPQMARDGPRTAQQAVAEAQKTPRGHQQCPQA